MPPPNARSPRHRDGSDGAPNSVRLGSRDNCSPDIKRSPRRQYLVRHLYACGERAVLESLLALESGQSLDAVLEDFARLPPEIYKAIGADLLPIDDVIIIDGGAA
jgi:hypothetical protein